VKIVKQNVYMHVSKQKMESWSTKDTDRSKIMAAVER